MKSIAVLGSTGSIGTQTFDVVRTEPGAYDVVAIAAGSSADPVIVQAREFQPELVVMATPEAANTVRDALGPGTTVAHGPEALADAARMAETVVNGVVGFAGLPVTLAALEAGRRLALANKESLIAAGPVVQRIRATPGAELIPVDSEHAAIHQCLRSSGDDRLLGRLQLTASGGPFRGRSVEDLAAVTVDEALKHPTWSMGPKITIDSSTLMNKGLEVIEANELFGSVAGPAGYGIDIDDIEVVVHPQSIVHSMVTYRDGSTIAQLSNPDMRLPIAYALAYPDRFDVAYGRIDWAELGRLDFEPPDREAFPCLDLAFAAGRTGGTAPAWLSAANEVAVAAFLDGKISWSRIAEVIAATMDTHDGAAADDLEAVLDGDRRARSYAEKVLAG